MNKKEVILLLLGSFFITAIFFYKMFLHGFVPFPGDLLISTYNPWKTYSYLGYVSGSFPSKDQYFDVLRQIYPWKTFAISLLKQGQIPLWNPFNFSGAPLLANFQSAVFYPLNILYFFTSQITAWSVIVFLQPFLTLVFTYLFARKLGISTIASFFSAISFSFSSFLSVWLEYNTIGHVILWLPLLLLSIEYILEKKTMVWLFVFLFAIVASAFGGHMQIFAYVFVFSFLYLAHRIITRKKISKRKETMLFMASLFILGLGLASVQLFPGLELIHFAARSPHDYNFFINKILIQPLQLIMIFIPDFFGNPATHNYWLMDTYIGKVTSIGSIPLLFVFFTLSQWKNNTIRFFLGTCLVMLLLATNNPFSQVLYRFQIPFISSSSPTLGIFLLCFSLSLLTGFGVDIFRKNAFNNKYFVLFGSTVVIFVIFFLLIFFESKLGLFKGVAHAHIALRNLLYESGILIIAISLIITGYKKRKFLIPILLLLLCVHSVDAWRSFQKFNPFVPKQIVFPNAQIFSSLKEIQGIDRFWSFGSASIEANYATQYNLFSPNGYDPLYPKWYGEFLQSSKDGKIVTSFTDQTRSDAVIAPSNANDFAGNQNRLKLLSLLGVKYILDNKENASSEKTFPINSFTPIKNLDGWRIFENKQVLPRAFIVSSYETFTSPEDFSKKFFNKNFDPGKTVLLQENLKQKLFSTKNSLHLMSYTPSKIDYLSQTNGNALLFLSDTYYPGWNAYIDNKKTTVYRADYSFRAVVIPPGLHKVSFTFESMSFKIGSSISLASILIVIGLLVIFGIKNKHNLQIPKS